MNNEGDDVRSGKREKEKNTKKKTRGVQYLLMLLAEGEKLGTFILTPLLLPRRYKFGNGLRTFADLGEHLLSSYWATALCQGV